MYSNYTNTKMIGNIGYQTRTRFAPTDVCYQQPMKSMHGYQLGLRGAVDLIRNGVDGVMIGGGSVFTKYQTSRDYGDVPANAVIQAAMNTILQQPTRAEQFRADRIPDWQETPLPPMDAAPEIVPTEQKQSDTDQKQSEQAQVNIESATESSTVESGKGKPRKGRRIPKGRKPDPPLPIVVKPLNDDGPIKSKLERKSKRKQDPAARLRKMLAKKNK